MNCPSRLSRHSHAAPYPLFLGLPIGIHIPDRPEPLTPDIPPYGVTPRRLDFLVSGLAGEPTAAEAIMLVTHETHNLLCEVGCPTENRLGFGVDRWLSGC